MLPETQNTSENDPPTIKTQHRKKIKNERILNNGIQFNSVLLLTFSFINQDFPV